LHRSARIEDRVKRTRKWAFVEQEAKRLAGLGLTPLQIAKRIGVNKSTVTRWVASGKLDMKATIRLSGTGQNPAQWASTVRKDYALDATDEQLVTIAESALAMTLDPSLAAHVRMNAAGRFQAIVRQLSLVTRAADTPVETKPAKTAPKIEAAPSRRVDPRKLLMMPGLK
jgi:hypothetical protein